LEEFSFYLEEYDDNKKYEDKLAKMKDKEVKALIFDKYLRERYSITFLNSCITTTVMSTIKMVMMIMMVMMLMMTIGQ
jgi:ABC-type lipoprotein release transport system permease subunit